MLLLLLLAPPPPARHRLRAATRRSRRILLLRQRLRDMVLVLERSGGVRGIAVADHPLGVGSDERFHRVLSHRQG